jgi:hypothetical protein
MEEKRSPTRPRPRPPRRPWLAVTLGGGLPAALAAAHAPWLAVAGVGFFNSAVIAMLYLFMEGPRPAREWAAAWKDWRALRDAPGNPERGP